MDVAFTAAGLGLLIAGTILYLVRRDHLHGAYAVWWLLVAAGVLAFGFYPRIVDRLSGLFGVHYPPMLLVLLVLAALLLKLVYVDIDASRRERRLRRAIQRLAIVELELKALQQQLAAKTDAEPPAARQPDPVGERTQ